MSALAREGGLQSVFWAGPEEISRSMKSGKHPVQGTVRKDVVRLRLGFAGEDFGYAISLGLPAPDATSVFSLDPQIKRECIWAGTGWRPAAALVDRKNSLVQVRADKDWKILSSSVSSFDSLFSQVADPEAAPEVFRLREQIRGWRFYDHFRTDADAPARHPQLGTRTTVLHHDGRDLAAAVQTIREIGDPAAFDAAIEDAFPGARVQVNVGDGGRFSIEFHQHGLLRPLTSGELSDGTLRYLLWAAALMTPRPPELMVLNEPETSLHPDLLPALARLIIAAAERSQVWVVSHASRLISALEEHEGCNSIRLEKELGETRMEGVGRFEMPAWKWPDE